MTEIVFLTDIHGNRESVRTIFKHEDPDFILIGGDVTDFGQEVDGVKEFLNEMPALTFVIPGNCDKREILSHFEASDAVSLHHKTIDVDDITFTGFGGSNPSPFGTPFEDSEEEISKVAEEIVAKLTKNRWNILLTHAPPYGVLDEVATDVHVGCHAIADIIKNFDIVCCGHIHEMKNIAMFNGKVCVNPGPAKDGNYAVIELDDDSEPIITLKNIRDFAE
ncbi:MAG TPA: metallophosphoesterase [Methanocorpusculum sp.]|nr:metallophosphoesterase [Methanocorpusculum sp.]